MCSEILANLQDLQFPVIRSLWLKQSLSGVPFLCWEVPVAQTMHLARFQLHIHLELESALFPNRFSLAWSKRLKERLDSSQQQHGT